MQQTDYQQEQLEAFNLVRKALAGPLRFQRDDLRIRIADYLCFREDVDAFFQTRFSGICTRNCYEHQLSACCSRDGIITFFADVVINVLLSEASHLTALIERLTAPHVGFKCIYLSPQGCVWRMKPLICAMFLCDPAQKEVFGRDPAAAECWQELRRREKRFRYPDRPVLFDTIERIFIDSGCRSPLMYLHNSPGLLRVKKQAEG